MLLKGFTCEFHQTQFGVFRCWWCACNVALLQFYLQLLAGTW